MNAEDIAQYLKVHPNFFSEHAHVLADVYLPHPHGGRTISIGERQVLALRDKVKLLEAKLAELIQFGEDNDAVSEKVHRLGLALILARDLEGVLQSTYFNLREDFAVPHIALRLWGDFNGYSDKIEFSPVTPDLRTYAESLAHPACGPHALYDTSTWFGQDAPRLRSFAMVALRGEQTFGLLALASEEAERFYPEMGTLYLKRVGELISTALLQYSSNA